MWVQPSWEWLVFVPRCLETHLGRPCGWGWSILELSSLDVGYKLGSPLRQPQLKGPHRYLTSSLDFLRVWQPQGSQISHMGLTVSIVDIPVNKMKVALIFMTQLWKTQKTLPLYSSGQSCHTPVKIQSEGAQLPPDLLGGMSENLGVMF